jgi:ElaB/YqjD/DUF883 family membrane-anchored ribosome-binding protein
MSDTEHESNGQSTVEQVQEKVQEVSEQARQAAVPLQERIREELSTRSSQLSDQASALGEALRTTSDDLHGKGQSEVARIPEQAADVVERCSRYLQQADGDRILRDLEDFGRQRPWAVVAGAATAGFLASRFLKASSSRRYQRGDVASQPTGQSASPTRTAMQTVGAPTPLAVQTRSYAPPPVDPGAEAP